MPSREALLAASMPLLAACASLAGRPIVPRDGRFSESTEADGAVRAEYEDAAAFLAPGRVALISFIRSKVFRGEERVITTSVCITGDPDDCSSARWFVNDREVRARADGRLIIDDVSDAICFRPFEGVFDLDVWTDLRRVELMVCGVRIAFNEDQIDGIRRVVAAVPKVDRPETHIFFDWPADKGELYPVRPTP
jgi:hypothetical protein